MQERLSKLVFAMHLLRALQAKCLQPGLGGFHRHNEGDGQIDRISRSKDDAIKPPFSYIAANVYDGRADACSPPSAISWIDLTFSPRKAELLLDMSLDITVESYIAKFAPALQWIGFVSCYWAISLRHSLLLAFLRLIQLAIRSSTSFSRNLELISGRSVLKIVLAEAWDSDVNRLAPGVIRGQAGEVTHCMAFEEWMVGEKAGRIGKDGHGGRFHRAEERLKESGTIRGRCGQECLRDDHAHPGHGPGGTAQRVYRVAGRSRRVAILKKGKDTDSYKVVRMESCILRKLFLIIEKGLTEWVMRRNIVPDSRNGLRTGFARGEYTAAYPSYVQSQTGSTNIATLWGKMYRQCAAGHWLEMFYARMQCIVRTDDLLMGDSASPILWTICLADLDAAITLRADDIRLAGRTISHLEQAVYVGLISKKTAGLQSNTDQLFGRYKHNSTMSVKKTRCMP
ncbi:hypothetical protein CYLTODRAFT_415522 [Cylindrobasidium torrendii FP15055 ss-10]|uniref:Reverse transcriptase domain-containing protein n=1 Tax=Cylindrobasidium torrendii FP15055 ss-10 TaxID=1314674 RepID=A0A0D7AVL4_9AGAR|nr:hypothetical protein CYLTODRAFT_415522 [Cylindrobasidium torrendii FP15055 ss-10]